MRDGICFGVRDAEPGDAHLLVRALRRDGIEAVMVHQLGLGLPGATEAPVACELETIGVCLRTTPGETAWFRVADGLIELDADDAAPGEDVRQVPGLYPETEAALERIGDRVSWGGPTHRSAMASPPRI